MARETTFSVRATQGGRLMNIPSVDNVGVGNYSIKTNWRRENDAEVPREGHLPFKGNITLSNDTAQTLSIGSDIIGMFEATRPNGDRAIVAASKTTIYRFDYATGTWLTIGSGFSANTTYWEGEQLDGYLILNNGIDLPVTFRVESSAVSPIYEMRENGIASVGHISVHNGFLVCADISEVVSSYLPTLMNSATPYGLVGSAYVNRIRYKLLWSDYGAPRNWSPVVLGTIQSATKNKVTLAFPMPITFGVGSKLAVIGAGPNGTTLGGQAGYDDGVTVTAVNGAEITLNLTAEFSLTYPLTVSVTRFADVSTFAGSSSIKDDSSAILAVRSLKQILVVYRETGIWIGRYTGSVETPFQFRPAYKGPNVLAHPRAIADIDGDYHLFVGPDCVYRFDGAGSPSVHRTTTDASALLFDSITANPSASAEKVFASHNSITREWWFHYSGGVLAYSYLYDSCSTIDTPYTAAVIVRKPNSTDNIPWFVTAAGGKVLQYAVLDSGPICYTRSSVAGVTTPVTCVLKRGEVTLNDDESEKDLNSYMPLFAAIPQVTGSQLIVTLFGRDNIAQTPDTLCAVSVEDATRHPLIETFFRNVYFSDSITYVPSSTTQMAKLLGCTYSFSRVGSRGVTRNNDGSL
jgi:hypothetical protein